MKSFLNPFFLIWIAKNYLSEIDRIFSSNINSIKKYQDKKFRKIMKDAFKTPVYQDKYKKAGLNSKDINGIKDIKKIPIMTREDLRAYHPKGIFPTNYNINKLQVVKTTGTTHQRLPLYTNFRTIIKTLLGNLRVLKYHNIDWKTDKITIITDLTQWRRGTIYIKKTIPILRNIINLNNIKLLDANDKNENLIRHLIKFKPDAIGSYPETLRRIASSIERKKITGIKPQNLLTTGDYIDQYRKKYIEKIFQSKLFDTYDSTESGPIAFQCKQGKYHINSDFVNVEIKKNNQISSEGTGEIIVTRLYGGGTPIIRYSGIEDIISLKKNDCGCKLNTDIITSIHGRKSMSIILPDGKKIYSSSIQDSLYQTMYQLNTNKIHRVQFVQTKKDHINILVKINENLRETSPSVNELLERIESTFIGKFGSEVTVNAEEVEKIPSRTPFIVSNLLGN